MAYTTTEKQLLRLARKLVRELFKAYPTPAHDESHARRVAKNAVLIAHKEKAPSVFLCELAGLLHDIGRMREKYTFGNTRRHHELSYDMLREWFRQYSEFDALTKKQKKEILYAIRYHWNDGANRYETAWILRDADKLDMFGNTGLKRHIEFAESDEETEEKYLRLAFSAAHWFRTKTAKQIVEKKKLFRPVEKYYIKKLRSKIKKVEI